MGMGGNMNNMIKQAQKMQQNMMKMEIHGNIKE